MADIKGPPRKKSLGEAPPAATEVVGNIEQKAGWKDLNFKVTPEEHHFFKSLAIKNRLSNKELLLRAINLFVEKHGGL